VKSILLVIAGGAIGSVLRYGVSLWIKPEHTLAFPVHTLTVNLVGCLLIGFVFALLQNAAQGQVYSLFIITGILGGFTTFSSFGLETFYLFQNGAAVKAIIYVLLSNVLGIGAVALGYFIHKTIA
jgi:CrcB protein